LCRFYDPTCGRITINGHDLRDIDLESWYACLGVLCQDYSDYRLPVRDVIALGRTSRPVNRAGVFQAAQVSEAGRFIRSWPQGFQQMLGKEFAGGVEPSGGQWQKLALARTLYRDPPVLILDEPTAAVDAESETRILGQLNSRPGRSIILIAHRLSVLRHTDRICVIEGGILTELGSHDELLDSSGTYARLFTLQAAAYR
jgi:ATP-binding cassette subfamily B protein